MRNLAPIISIVILFLIIFAAVGYTQWKKHNEQESRTKLERERKADRRKAEDEGIKRGVLLRDSMGEVFARCQICESHATEFGPVTRTSWLDQISGLTKLYNLPPRYVVAFDTDGPRCYCRSHARLAEKMLEELHAGLRAERSRFNSQQEDKVSFMETGGLVAAMKRQNERAQMLASQSAEGTPVAMLTTGEDLTGLGLETVVINATQVGDD